MLKESIRAIFKTILPVGILNNVRLQKKRFSCWPPVGWVRFGALRRLKPISPFFGFERGLSIDRYYIEKFLLQHRADIKRHVLEIGDDTYTRKFGGNRVVKSDMLHFAEGNPKATIVADLTSAEDITSETFDCIIFTQTLQFIYEVRLALKTLYRILKPGGVLLATFPGISQISQYDMVRWGEYWRFTTLSAKRLFSEVFLDTKIEVSAFGNVLVAIAFLQGLAKEELRQADLDVCDPDYEVLITVRAVK